MLSARVPRRLCPGKAALQLSNIQSAENTIPAIHQ